MKRSFLVLFLSVSVSCSFAQSITADTIWTRDLSSVEAFSVAFSPNGEKVAVAYACHGPLVRVFEAVDGEVAWESSTPDLCLYAVQFSSDGNYIAIAEEVGHLTVFNMNTLQLEYNLDTQSGGMYCVDFTPDGSKIVVGCIDGSVRIYETATSELVQVIPAHQGAVLGVDVSDDGQFIASGGEDDLVKIWSVGTWQHFQTFTGHLDNVRCVKFTPSTARLISGSADDDVKVWNTWTGELITTLSEHWADVNSVDVSDDEGFLVSGSNDMSIKIHDLYDYHLMGSITDFNQTRVYGVSISPDQKQIAAAIQNGAVYLWQLNGPVGVHESTTPVFSLYPNPVGNQLRIQTKDPDYHVEIYSMTGAKLGAYINPSEISMENYSAGIYTVRYFNGDFVQTQKLIKR